MHNRNCRTGVFLSCHGGNTACRGTICVLSLLKPTHNSKRHVARRFKNSSEFRRFKPPKHSKTGGLISLMSHLVNLILLNPTWIMMTSSAEADEIRNEWRCKLRILRICLCQIFRTLDHTLRLVSIRAKSTNWSVRIWLISGADYKISSHT